MWLHWSAKQISACAKDEEFQDGNRSVQFNDEVGIIAWPKSLDGFVAACKRLARVAAFPDSNSGDSGHGKYQ